MVIGLTGWAIEVVGFLFPLAGGWSPHWGKRSRLHHRRKRDDPSLKGCPGKQHFLVIFVHDGKQPKEQIPRVGLTLSLVVFSGAFAGNRICSQRYTHSCKNLLPEARSSCNSHIHFQILSDSTYLFLLAKIKWKNDCLGTRFTEWLLSNLVMHL